MALDPRALWPVFTGLVFFLMGLSLAADARAHAASALDWQKETQGAEASGVGSIIWAYRAFGTAFAGAGLWLIGGWFFFRATLAERLGSAALGPVSGPGAGAALLVCGAGLSIFKPGRGRRVPEFVQAEQPAEAQPLGRRVGAWCRRLIVALFVVFGFLLIVRSPS